MGVESFATLQHGATGIFASMELLWVRIGTEGVTSIELLLLLAIKLMLVTICPHVKNVFF